MQIAATDSFGIYRALYNQVTSRLQAALPGSTLPMTLPAFLYTVSIAPTHTDLATVDEFPGHSRIFADGILGAFGQTSR